MGAKLPEAHRNEKEVNKRCQKTAKQKHKILEPDNYSLAEIKNKHKQKQYLPVDKGSKN